MTHELPSRATFPAGTTPAGIGEFALVEALASRFPQHPDVLLGPGDDAAVVAMPGTSVVVSTDLLVDRRHFRRDWSSAADIGHKAAAQNLSDINAMGATATALTVGMALPDDIEVAWLLELADGMAAECAEVGASIVGGDLSRATELVLAVTVLGAGPGQLVTRSGARAGDVVAVAGRLGWAAAGLAVLARGFRSPRVVVEAHRRPTPPYRAGPEARELGATAMVDVSDGLVADAGHVARASEVSIDLQADAFEIDEPLQAVGSALGIDPLGLVLTGGDDHALLATFPADVSLPASWTVVGRVVERLPDGVAVTVDGAAFDEAGGHTHF